ncbi:MAG: 3-deoxy-8-phosphooctulonate synthase [Chitinivibrionales bacterium]|nr:3-deoxy-8-phosphooctulonate synthase [Chitinivibrionales bacterium]
MKQSENGLFKYNKQETGKKLFIIAGPCVIESEKLCLEIASKLVELSEKNKIDIVFKASYDKANRTSGNSFRGPGIKEGLKILHKVKETSGLPVLTDIHTPGEAPETAAVVDILQIPAFLSRQTDLLTAARLTGKYVNVKKGQFISPEEAGFALRKAGEKAWITERGTFFGYNRLVVDFAGIPIMKSFNCPVIFDATHSVQRPGAGDGVSSGNRDLAIPLARAAIGAGVDGLFFEIHPNPPDARCDAANSLYLSEFEREVPRLIELYTNIDKWNV